MAIWKAKPGEAAHAVDSTHSKKALCGRKISKDALLVVARILKCEKCKRELRKKNVR